MAIRTNFLAVFSIFRFASFAENLKGEDDEEFFVLVSALRSANAFPYALLLDVDFVEKAVRTRVLYKPINANVISFDLARARFFK